MPSSLSVTAISNFLDRDKFVAHLDSLVMKLPRPRSTRGFEEENRRLKQIVADLTLDNQALKAVTSKSGDAHGTSRGRGLPAEELRDERAAM